MEGTMAARVTAWSVVLLGAAMLAAGAALAFYSWITIFGLQLVGYNAISQVDSVRGSQGGIWAGAVDARQADWSSSSLAWCWR